MATSAIAFMPKRENLDFWIKNSLNVLFIGKHGVGKTSLIIDAFQGNNLKYKYFSASTMDPWVDFIGVPRSMEDDKGPYLDLVRPRDFRDDEIEALFFDEFNRSHKKVRNAVMELIQFKSINGRSFKNLKIIWAAINPEDEEDTTYDVENLDPAQKDRFHVHLAIPYEPHLPYFESKYGDTANAVVDWWKGLSPELKNEISPRRLDYALAYVNGGGDARHMLPVKSNISQFMHVFKNGSPIRKLKELIRVADTASLKTFLADNNNYNSCKDIICKSNHFRPVCLPLLGYEKLAALLAENNNSVIKTVMDNAKDYETVLKTIVSSLSNKAMVAVANKALAKIALPVSLAPVGSIEEHVMRNILNKKPTTSHFRQQLKGIQWNSVYPGMLTKTSLNASDVASIEAEFKNYMKDFDIKHSTTYERRDMFMQILTSWAAPFDILQAKLRLLDGICQRLHVSSLKGIIGTSPKNTATTHNTDYRGNLEKILWSLHHHSGGVSPLVDTYPAGNIPEVWNSISVQRLHTLFPSLTEKCLAPFFVTTTRSQIFA